MGYRYSLIVLCVLMNASISNASQVTATSLGKSITLPCQIENLDSDLRFLYWRKDGKTVYSVTSDGENAEGKYWVIDTASLVIPDAEDSDAGNYSCKVVRQSLSTEESDIMQLYVIDLSVSHCKDTKEDVNGCSCHVDSTNITFLECSAAGFPHPPIISWDESQITYRSSSVDLTRFSENVTLVCKARDRNVESVVVNKTVCVHSIGEPTGGSSEGTPIAPVKHKATLAAVLISIFVTLVVVFLTLLLLLIAYRLKKGKDLCLQTRKFWTSTPKTSSEARRPKLPSGMNSSGYDTGSVHFLKDSCKNSRASSIISELEPELISITGGNDDKDFSPKDCNEVVMVGDEKMQPLPLIAQVLLDDLSLSTAGESKSNESKKGVILALLAKRIKPYKIHQPQVDPNVTVHASSVDMNATLQRSIKIANLRALDADFVDMVLQDLDKILDERDRDECEILITKPDFFEDVTDESEIPAYQGNRVIHQSLPMQPNTPSSMTSSMVACIPLSSVLRKELLQKPAERTAIRNAISQIILDFLKKGHTGVRTNIPMLTGNNVSPYAHEDVDDEVSRLVAFWTSKTVKLDNDVNSHIKKYLFPLKPRNPNKGRDATVACLPKNEEHNGIPETSSIAKLLEDNIQR